MRHLENHGASPPDYPSMTDAQRVAANIATANLHWVGPRARTSGGVLSAGRVGDHIRMFAPNPQQPGSSVSHWDTALVPTELMEPPYTGPNPAPGLAVQLLEDLGWTCLPARALGESRFFDINCKADILWRDASGAVAVWLMNGATILTGRRRHYGRTELDSIVWRLCVGDRVIGAQRERPSIGELHGPRSLQHRSGPPGCA